MSARRTLALSGVITDHALQSYSMSAQIENNLSIHQLSIDNGYRPCLGDIDPIVGGLRMSSVLRLLDLDGDRGGTPCLALPPSRAAFWTTSASSRGEIGIVVCAQDEAGAGGIAHTSFGVTDALGESRQADFLRVHATEIACHPASDLSVALSAITSFLYPKKQH